MNKEELLELAIPIVTDGFADELSDDEVKMNMMGVGIPFSKLNSLVKEIRISEGLIVDPNIVKNDLNEKIEAVDWESVSDWADLSSIATSLADDTEGATVARAITLARAYCKNELDLALPRKPKGAGGTGSGRVGAIAQAVAELFATNKAPTKQEFYDAMIPVVGGDQQHANIIYYMGLHLAVCTAVATEAELKDVVKILAAQTNPVPGEGVSAVPRGSNAVDADVEVDDDFEEAA